MENETVVHSKSSENPSESKSTVEESKVPLISYASAGEINSSSVHTIVQFFGPESFENESLQIRIANYDTDEDKEVHTIDLEKQIQQGVYLLEIEYELSISDNVFFLANYSSSDGVRQVLYIVYYLFRFFRILLLRRNCLLNFNIILLAG